MAGLAEARFMANRAIGGLLSYCCLMINQPGRFVFVSGWNGANPFGFALMAGNTEILPVTGATGINAFLGLAGMRLEPKWGMGAGYLMAVRAPGLGVA